MTQLCSMNIDLRVGEAITIGDARIVLSRKDGQRARLLVQAPREVPIIRPKSQTGAQECASSLPEQGMKEQAHGQHPL